MLRRAPSWSPCLFVKLASNERVLVLSLKGSKRCSVSGPGRWPAAISARQRVVRPRRAQLRLFIHYSESFLSKSAQQLHGRRTAFVLLCFIDARIRGLDASILLHFFFFRLGLFGDDLQHGNVRKIRILMPFRLSPSHSKSTN